MILVLGGTREGREIVDLLIRLDKRLLASVTSNYGYKLLANYDIKINKKQLNKKELESLIIDNDVKQIIDATHPFAEEISRNAINAASSSDIKYIRYEREELDLKNFDQNLIFKVSNYKKAAEKAKEFEKILLTTGSQNLHQFTENISNWQKRLLIRILPISKNIKRLQNMGFSPANMIAIKGPFSEELNRVLLKDFQIKVMVSKASGSTGGLRTKLKAAMSLQIPVILIQRPKLEYNQVVKSYQELLRVLSRDTG